MHNFWCLYMQHYNVIVSLYRSLAYTSTQSNKYLNDLNMICWLHAIVYSKCILFWILRHLFTTKLFAPNLLMHYLSKYADKLNKIWIWFEYDMNSQWIIFDIGTPKSLKYLVHIQVMLSQIITIHTLNVKNVRIKTSTYSKAKHNFFR